MRLYKKVNEILKKFILEEFFISTTPERKEASKLYLEFYLNADGSTLSPKKNYLRANITDPSNIGDTSSFKFSYGGDSWSISANVSSKNVLKFNYNDAGNPLFTCYDSGSTANATTKIQVYLFKSYVLPTKIKWAWTFLSLRTVSACK